MIKVGQISDKDDILTYEGKRLACIRNKTKGSLEITPLQREIEAKQLKSANMRIQKLIGKIKMLSDIGESNMRKCITGEASKGSKTKKI